MQSNSSIVISASKAFENQYEEEYYEEEQDIIVVKKRNKFSRCLCYDEENRTWCGKSLCHWMNVLLFTVVYLMVLLLIVWGFLALTLHYIHTSGNISSLAKGSKFGMLRLIPFGEHTRDSLLILENETSNEAIASSITRSLRDTFSEYDNDDDGINITLPDIYGDCGRKPYGYDKGRPCFFFTDDDNALRNSTPNILIYCDGYHPWDKQHIGNLVFYPMTSNEEQSFPYVHAVVFTPPIMAIQAVNITPYVSITFYCRVWYELSVYTVEFTLYKNFV